MNNEYNEQNTVTNYLKGKLLDYVNTITQPSKKAGRNMFVCPLCGSGQRKDGAFSVDKKTGFTTWKCFSCGEQGDIFDLVGKIENLTSFTDQRNFLTNKFGEPTGQIIHLQAKTAQKKSPAPKAKPDFVKNLFVLISKYHANVDMTSPATYLKSRGFTSFTIRKFKLGYNPTRDTIIIPYPGDNYYCERFIYPKDHKYSKPKEDEFGTEPIFNLQALYSSSKPCFVCEGQFNAISIEQAGGRAIALGGTSGINKLVLQLKAKRPAGTLIISFDNDQAGQTATSKLSTELKQLGIKFIVANYDYRGYGDQMNDANDLLKANPVKFEAEIKANVQQAQRAIINKQDLNQLEAGLNYLNQGWAKDLDVSLKTKTKETGFEYLDHVTGGGLYPGLYVLGAISSLGKTTLVHQIADQLAFSGQNVLYFSLEQTQFELTNKSLARLTAQKYGADNAISAIRIRTGDFDGEEQNKIMLAMQEYRAKTAGRMMLLKPSFSQTDVNDLCRLVKSYIELYQVKPVVFVDYLQLLQAPADLRLQDKQKTDYVISALKELQTEYGLTMIVISSLNRANYLAPVDFESFKESGIIEYSADVLLGLQLQCLHEDIFTKKDKLTDKRERVKEAKAETPRKIELVCLKNRYGISNFSSYFDYYPACDLFVENLETLKEKEAVKSTASLTVV